MKRRTSPPQTLANRQFSKIISRLANGKVYIYTLANCQVGDFTFCCTLKLFSNAIDLPSMLSYIYYHLNKMINYERAT